MSPRKRGGADGGELAKGEAGQKRGTRTQATRGGKKEENFHSARQSAFARSRIVATAAALTKFFSLGRDTWQKESLVES